MEEHVLLPQHRFLLAAVAPDTVSPDDLTRLASDLAPHWTDLLGLAVRNRVASPAWALLDSDPFAHDVQDEIADQWRSANRAVVFLNRVARKQLVELAAVLASAEIKPLLYKGLDFAARYYTHPRLRAFRDLDIVVGPDEVLRADSALRAGGYRPLQDGMPLEYFRRFHLHAEYQHPNWPLPVELHWDLDSPYVAARADLESIRLRASQSHSPHSTEFGANVSRPCALDALALMGIHLKKHLALPAELPTREARLAAVLEGGGLIWLLDVVCWMREEAGSHGEESILRRFRELDAEDALAVSLRLACDLDAKALPDWARAAAERVPVHPSLLCRFVYGELISGQRLPRVVRWVAPLLLRQVEGLVFRPIRVLEALAPVRAKGGGGGGAWRRWLAHLARIAPLGAANLAAILRWKLRTWQRSP